MADPVVSAPRVAWRGAVAQQGERAVAREMPIALTYNRTTHAVMLGTPVDLEDFAVGFSLSEEIIGGVDEILGLEIVEVPDGVECRMDLAPEKLSALTRRQRRLAGPSGCGLCGLESLAQAIRPSPVVTVGREFTPAMVQEAMALMQPAQTLNAVTRAVHAAGFWTAERGLMALREDVGRHNALDKLSGAVARAGVAASEGMVLLSSRVSIEMVQKAAIMGAPVIVAISAPTSLAIEVADRAGITLIGVARSDGFEVFTYPDRISSGEVRDVA
ncbi:MAG TPA: formate dehydrogenase accessory sulfurtransferase FdhD [Rhodopila sp.]|nr:formate dehydrogenase accessory sulfurtransferase FdhD [Rhodopila sp.]